MASLRDIIVSALAGELARPASDFTDGTSWEGLKADSLDVLGCVSAVEQAVGCVIPPEALESIQTVGDLVQYVVSLPMMATDTSPPP